MANIKVFSQTNRQKDKAKSLCPRSIDVGDLKIEISFGKGRKHYGKRGKYWFTSIFSFFHNVFTRFLSRNRDCVANSEFDDTSSGYIISSPSSRYSVSIKSILSKKFCLRYYKLDLFSDMQKIHQRLKVSTHVSLRGLRRLTWVDTFCRCNESGFHVA